MTTSRLQKIMTTRIMQILSLTISHRTYYAILCTNIAEHAAESQKEEKWCSDLYPSA